MGVLFLLFSVFLYFIPSIVAASKNKRNSGAIFALNFFLGWTIVGWVAALVWALTSDAQLVVAAPSPAVAPTSVQLAPPQKKCPECAEMVLAEAKKCRFCGYQFDAAALS